jgi:4-amino-4-deoxy-L-arabinose transferase-like glycosyltransferase
MLLVMFVTGSTLFFVYGFHACTGRKKWFYMAMHASVGFALFTKGPVGMILPWLGIVAYLISVKRVGEFKSMYIIQGLVIISLIITPWCWAVYSRIDTSFAVFYNETVRRFVNAFDHQRPFYYYFTQTPVCMLPWGILFPFIIWDMIKNRRFRRYGLPIAFFVPAFIFFTLCKSKQSHYLLPLYPYAGLAVSIFLYDLKTSAVPWEKAVGLVRKMKCEHYAVLVLLFSLSYAGMICTLRLMNRQNSPREFCTRLNAIIPKESLFVTYNYSKPYLVYYLKRTLPVLRTEQELTALLRDDPSAYILIREKNYKQVMNLNAEPVYKYEHFMNKYNNMILLRGVGKGNRI